MVRMKFFTRSFENLMKFINVFDNPHVARLASTPSV